MWIVTSVRKEIGLCVCIIIRNSLLYTDLDHKRSSINVSYRVIIIKAWSLKKKKKKGMKPAAPSRDKRLVAPRQIKVPLVSTLQNHRDLFHPTWTSDLGDASPPPAALGEPAQTAVLTWRRFHQFLPTLYISWLKPVLCWYPKTILERKMLLPQAFWCYHMSEE